MYYFKFFESDMMQEQVRKSENEVKYGEYFRYKNKWFLKLHFFSSGVLDFLVT